MGIQSHQWQTEPPLNHFYSNKSLKVEQREIWEQVERYLGPWLDERQVLIEAWHRVLNEALEEKSSYDLEYSVQILCETLMDYISAGHFEIYEKLLEESRTFNDGFLSLAEPLYILINHSTEFALRFNEHYADSKNCQLRKKKLPHELSRLGEKLEERFEAEDQLVKFLHQLHQH